MLRYNPAGDHPEVNESAYVDPAATIIGKVNIGANVFIGPGAVIRADEDGSSITVKDNCNIQDRVIIHALEGASVLINENTSLTHGCVIHGPCVIGSNCFIGFGSVIFRSDIGNGACIKHLAVIEDASVPPDSVIGSHSKVGPGNGPEEKAPMDRQLRQFMTRIVDVNLGLVKGYKKNKNE